MRKIFISTGEVSGDLQGALLIESLQRQAVTQGLELEIAALGGSKMAAAGAKLLGDTSAIGSVGLWESLPYVLPTLQVQRQAKQALKQDPPDLVVLIDYMGPNLSIGSFVRRELPQVPIVYYIVPQVWVWSLSPRDPERLMQIADHLFAIFPEEARFFAQRGAKVTWVGHPLIDRMQRFPSREQARSQLGIAPDQVAVALIPASRRQELKYLMPVILEAAQALQAQIPQVHFWIPLALEAYRESIEAAIAHYPLRATLVDSNLDCLAAADLAITKSGTVNLELALLNVPQVVVYKVSPLTCWIARNLLRFSIPFMSPPNLVQMQPIVPEFLQEQATSSAIVQESLDLLFNPARKEKIRKDYQQMGLSLGESGVCDRTAQILLNLLQTKP